MAHASDLLAGLFILRSEIMLYECNTGLNCSECRGCATQLEVCSDFISLEYLSEECTHRNLEMELEVPITREKTPRIS